MKVFVTVGNTHYNGLIEAIDNFLSPDEFDVSIQMASGSYYPKNHKFFSYTNDISKYYNEADVIVTHAGAGTVFQLLEEQQKMVVVPNNERLDDHQKDLAHYIDSNNFACVCFNLNQIKNNVLEAFKHTFLGYQHEPFSGFNLITELFSKSENNFDECITVGKLPLNIFESMVQAVNSIINDAGNVIPGSAIAINPEKVIRSLKDPSIYNTIMSASIRYADGIGVVKTLERKSKQRISRIPGCELWEELMNKSGQLNIPVFLLGASKDVITETDKQL